MSRASVRRETLAEQVAAALREEIFSGDLSPGAKINIDDAAERLGMSQIPVREALRALAAVGLVDFVPQRGYTVSEANLADFLDTYRLRRLLVPLAIELSVPRLDADDLQRARDALEHLTSAMRARNWEDHRRYHRDFHFAFYAKCDSSWLLRILEMLWENSERYQRISADPRGTPTERAREHQAILEAAATGDGHKTAEAVLEHMTRTQQTLERVFATQRT